MPPICKNTKAASQLFTACTMKDSFRLSSERFNAGATHIPRCPRPTSENFDAIFHHQEMVRREISCENQVRNATALALKRFLKQIRFVVNTQTARLSSIALPNGQTTTFDYFYRHR